MKPHPHANLMRQYAEDAAETDKPWERWEYCGSDPPWIRLTCHPQWWLWQQYRRRPRTITINGIEVPEPMREAPELNSVYWYPQFGYTNIIGHHKWTGDETDRICLSHGICHSTPEAAALHAKALLSFTGSK